VASNDLLGLGDEEGPPVVYDWSAPSPIPQFIPWAFILALLGLRANRKFAAWAVVFPLLVLASLEAARAVLEFIPSDELRGTLSLARSMGFGLAALLLLMPQLDASIRFLAFLKALMVLGGVSLGAYVIAEADGFSGDTAAMIIAIGFTAFVYAVAVTMAGWHCRKRYHTARYWLWAAAWVVVIISPILAFFAVLASVVGGNGPDFAEFIGPFLVILGIGLSMLLPFIVLSVISGFFRQRVGQWARLVSPEAPPLIEPLPEPTEITRE
jgi:hypothetical protein